MKIAVTDACIFIDILDLELHTYFFALELEIHTTLDVFNELSTEQQKTLTIYQSESKLSIHILSKEEQLRILTSTEFPRSLSSQDKSVLILAEKLDATLLSSDKSLRKAAKTRCIDYHGLIWIFDQLVNSGQIDPHNAIEKLKSLLVSNQIYQNSTELKSEVEKRIKIWS